MSKYKILIVEDNKDLNDLYELVFKKKWFDTLYVTNWKKALTAVVDFKPDFVLLDIMMPEMNWFEFLMNFFKDIHGVELDKKITIAVNSNLSQDSDIKKAFELWADYYFKKSDLTPLELASRVSELLEWKKA